MTSRKGKGQKKHLYLTIFIATMLMVLISGIPSAHAYYSSSSNSLKIFGNLVGDYDYAGGSDVNIIVYLENAKGSGYYAKTNAIPTSGYTFQPTQTKCYTPTTATTATTVECVNGISGNCYYNFTSPNITLNSNQKVTCKFYFSHD